MGHNWLILYRMNRGKGIERDTHTVREKQSFFWGEVPKPKVIASDRRERCNLTYYATNCETGYVFKT